MPPLGLRVPPCCCKATENLAGEPAREPQAHIMAESGGSSQMPPTWCEYTLVFLPSAAVIKKLHFHLFSHFSPPQPPPEGIQHESHVPGT